MRRAARFLYLLLAITAVSALAQTTGSVNGTVLDGQGAALPSAELVLTNVATGQTRQLTSSSEGYFLFGDLSPAVYRLKEGLSVLGGRCPPWVPESECPE